MSQVKDYIRTIFWLLAETRRRYFFRASAMVLTDVFAIAAQLLALRLIFMTIRHLESSDPSISSEMIFNLGFQLFGMLILAALGLFAANLIRLNMRTRFESDCTKALLLSLEDKKGMVDLWCQGGNNLVYQIVRSDPRACGRALEKLHMCFQPLFMLISVLALIFILHFESALVLVGVMAIALIGLGFVGRSASQANLEMDRASSGYGQAIRDLTDKIASSKGDRQLIETALKEMDQEVEIQDFKVAYRKRLHASPWSSLVGGIATAIAVSLILYLVVNDAIAGNLSWAIVFLFVIGARFAMNAHTRIGTSITGIHRDHAQVKRLRDTLSSTPTDLTSHPFEPPDGEPCCIIAPMMDNKDFNQTALLFLTHKLCIDPLKYFSVSGSFPLDDKILGKALDLPSSTTFEELQKQLVALECWDEIESRLPTDIWIKSPVEHWKKHNAFVIFALRACSAIVNVPPRVLISTRGFRRMSADARKHLMNSLSSSQVIFIANRIEASINPYCQNYYILSDHGLEGPGKRKWALENLDSSSTSLVRDTIEDVVDPTL